MKPSTRLLIIIWLGMALFPGTAVHAAMTGADFLQAPESYQSGFINGFVRGIYAACLDHMETRKEICSFAPVLDTAYDMTPDQVLDLFLGYLKKKSAHQEKEATELLVDCLKEAARKPANPR